MDSVDGEYELRSGRGRVATHDLGMKDIDAFKRLSNTSFPSSSSSIKKPQDSSWSHLGDSGSRPISTNLSSLGPCSPSIDIKTLLANFETTYTHNTAMRIKFAHDPTRFVQSEVDLDYHLKQLQAIATLPNLYPTLAESPSLESLLSLTSHENADIVIDVIDLLKDLLAWSEDMRQVEDREMILHLGRNLLQRQALQRVTNAIYQLDETLVEEKQGVYNIVEFVDNLSELDINETCRELINQCSRGVEGKKELEMAREEGELDESIVVNQHYEKIGDDKRCFLGWLIQRIAKWTPGTNDQVPCYAAELLCLLAQHSQAIQDQIGKLNGIDILLQVISHYRKISPTNIEEEEMVENVISILCVASANHANCHLFLQAQGLELIRLLIQAYQFMYCSSLKLLSYALMNDVDMTTKWITLGGLGTLFAAFMKPTNIGKIQQSSSSSRKNQPLRDVPKQQESEQHIISALVSISAALRDDPLHAHYMDRFINKFKELDFEKLEHLIELRQKYAERLGKIELKLAREDNEEEARDEMDEAEIYLDRMEGGLSILQLIDNLLATLVQKDKAIQHQTIKLLKLQGSNLEDLKKSIMEITERLGMPIEENQLLQGLEPCVWK